MPLLEQGDDAPLVKQGVEVPPDREAEAEVPLDEAAETGLSSSFSCSWSSTITSGAGRGRWSFSSISMASPVSFSTLLFISSSLGTRTEGLWCCCLGL